MLWKGFIKLECDLEKIENFDNIESFVDLMNLKNFVGENKIQSLDNLGR